MLPLKYLFKTKFTVSKEHKIMMTDKIFILQLALFLEYNIIPLVKTQTTSTGLSMISSSIQTSPITSVSISTASIPSFPAVTPTFTGTTIALSNTVTNLITIQSTIQTSNTPLLTIASSPSASSIATTTGNNASMSLWLEWNPWDTCILTRQRRNLLNQTQFETEIVQISCDQACNLQIPF